MNQHRTCPQCGGSLPVDTLDGLCPRCVLQVSLGRAASCPEDVLGCSAEQTGEFIGRYKLLQQIGEGGCGIVYMAEQEEPVQRRVALKVIKLGMDTKQVIARFEAERQALAMMDHHNIAKVLDAGSTDNGRPFFVMELVRGIKITDYCDQNHLSTKHRLELFLQVCKAIQHAHQKGIIHRDIKPSNILVTLHDGVPVPKVIDFGIAKATQGKLTDQTLFTAFEQFMGTPAYMSPEQAEMSGLDIDTRSDIYSLGVLLYELLTGQTPFDTKELLALGLDEMRRTIREKEPARPSMRLSTTGAVLTNVAQHRQIEPDKLASLIRGDLDWVVMKALEKDRTRRYETANGLAMDVERYLKTEPVVARPPNQCYLLGKLVRRHKLAFAATSALAVSLIVGLSVSTWLFSQERKAEREQHRMWLHAERDRTNAQREAKRSRQVAYFLENTFGDIAPSLAKKCTKPYVQEVLARADQRIRAGLSDQPDVEAIVRTALAGVQMDMGQFADAETNLMRVLGIKRGLCGNQHPEVAITLARLVELLCAEDKRLQAEPLANEAIRILEQLALNRPQNQRLDPAQGQPESLSAKSGALDAALKMLHATKGRFISEDMINDTNEARISALLAAMFERAGRPGEAIIEYRRALEILEQAIVMFPQDSNLERNRDTIRGDLATVLNAQGKASEVEALITQRPHSRPPSPTKPAVAPQGIPLIIMDDVPLRVAIENLAKQAELSLTFDPRVTIGQPDAQGKFPSEPLVRLRWEKLTAEQALKNLLAEYKLILESDAENHRAVITVAEDPAKADEGASATDPLGKTLPGIFTLKLLCGGEIDMPPATNHGPILLDFFASWCRPCQLVTPVIAQIAKEYSNQGVRYLAISCWGEKPDAVRTYLSRAKLDISVALDDKKVMTDAFKVDAVPKIFLLDRSNRIRYVHVGETPELPQDLRRALNEVLSTQPASGQGGSP